VATLASHKAASGASVAYRRIVVPLDGGAPAVRAACTLADEHGAVVTALAVVEVPAALPLDALMPDEEAAARERLGAAEAVGDRHGVRVVRSTVRARREGEAIVEAAEDADLIVLRRQLDKTARYVLQHAQCRVLFSRPRP
jgi:nucleotide-binding universal stress UspA family protein